MCLFNLSSDIVNDNAIATSRKAVTARYETTTPFCSQGEDVSNETYFDVDYLQWQGEINIDALASKTATCSQK